MDIEDAKILEGKSNTCESGSAKDIPNGTFFKPEKTFGIGQIVKLKCGGFDMIVSDTQIEGHLITCMWHDSSGCPCCATYTPELLERVI